MSKRRNKARGSKRFRQAKSKRNADLLLVFEEFQRRGDAPQCLRDYIYENIGRVL